MRSLIGIALALGLAACGSEPSNELPEQTLEGKIAERNLLRASFQIICGADMLESDREKCDADKARLDQLDEEIVAAS